MSLLAVDNLLGSSSLVERMPGLTAWLKDLVFPPTCGGCGRVDYQFCAVCAEKLALLPVEYREHHVETVDAVFATGRHAGILADAIRAFKYAGAPQLAEPLAARLDALLTRQLLSVDVLVPVPLSGQRLVERGYNQSELLAKRLSEARGISCNPSLLRRVRHTEKQAQLSGVERNQNVEGAFAADGAHGLSVLLIDDVVTTGSTLRECASALRNKGATAVYAIAVSASG